MDITNKQRINDMSFLVITYNQKDYILNTLMSVLHQTQQFFSDMTTQLVIADDASDDGSQQIIEDWIEKNRIYFSEINYVRNCINQGVCNNITNGIKTLNSKYVKLVAGDDILPVTSIRNIVYKLKKYDIVMGIPIYFNAEKKEQELLKKQYEREMIHVVARVLFEKNKSFKKRIDRALFIHAPSAVFRTSILKNEQLLSFITSYKHIDDYSMLYKLGVLNPNIKFEFVPDICILYRRTSGSIYLRWYNEFISDKKRLAKTIMLDKKTSLYNQIVKLEEVIIYSFGNKKLHVYGIPDYWIRKIGIYSNIIKAKKIILLANNDIEKNNKYIETLYRET